MTPHHIPAQLQPQWVPRFLSTAPDPQLPHPRPLLICPLLLREDPLGLLDFPQSGSWSCQLLMRLQAQSFSLPMSLVLGQTCSRKHGSPSSRLAVAATRLHGRQYVGTAASHPSWRHDLDLDPGRQLHFQKGRHLRPKVLDHQPGTTWETKAGPDDTAHWPPLLSASSMAPGSTLWEHVVTMAVAHRATE